MKKKKKVSDFDDFDRDFNRLRNFAIGWFIFVTLLALAILSGVGFVVYRLLAYLGAL